MGKMVPAKLNNSIQNSQYVIASVKTHIKTIESWISIVKLYSHRSMAGTQVMEMHLPHLILMLVIISDSMTSISKDVRNRDERGNSL